VVTEDEDEEVELAWPPLEYRDEEFQAFDEMNDALIKALWSALRLDLKDLPGHGILSSKEPQ
jgi:hypothetical protein